MYNLLYVATARIMRGVREIRNFNYPAYSLMRMDTVT
jgi:hypothetical protein